MAVAASSRQGAIRDPALFPIADRVAAGQRLSASDAATLFRSADLLGVGALADAVNRARHGDVVTFAANQHINPTNVCILRKTCVFCGYATMCRALKREFPHMHIKALTAVEIAHLSRIEKMSWEDVLIALREAGL